MPSTGVFQVEQRRIALRRALLGDALRSTRQDDPHRLLARSFSTGVLNGTTSE